MADPKKGTGKKPKKVVVDFIQTKTLKILFQLSMQPKKTPEIQLLK